MKLYHGSNVKIETPDLTHSKPYKDFGRGFYLSADKQQAWDMALQKVNQTQEGTAVVTEFLFDETQMESDDLKILSIPDYSEEWAQFILANRNRHVTQPVHDYDIIYGPIANDGVTFQLRRYEGGVISLHRLVEELKYAKGITFQYYFGTERALKLLTRI
ncbi:MAG: DUF3990 domain-containing protein [Prevotella sp.]|nr:DUF3990 domain-containing protein [Prevotella sp.]MBR1461844.1 DUF3990 domain-containing protein [Prevotella sp.]